VHCSETSAFFCPLRSCKRNKQGFHRKYNLLEHQKRRHRLQFSGRGLSEGSSERENSQEHLLFEDGEEAEERVQAKDRDEGRNGPQDLKGRLKRLREMRAKIDGDIILLERAFIVMEGVSL
jgi:hypothetical protein